MVPNPLAGAGALARVPELLESIDRRIERLSMLTSHDRFGARSWGYRQTRTTTIVAGSTTVQSVWSQLQVRRHHSWVTRDLGICIEPEAAWDDPSPPRLFARKSGSTVEGLDEITFPWGTLTERQPFVLWGSDDEQFSIGLLNPSAFDLTRVTVVVTGAWYTVSRESR